jgi:hypothetical protein
VKERKKEKRPSANIFQDKPILKEMKGKSEKEGKNILRKEAEMEERGIKMELNKN